MNTIPCRQSVILKASETDTGYGFKIATACKKAQDNATKLVNENLTAQQQEYKCQQPCPRIVPIPAITFAIHECEDCERLWWTLFILARCEATVDAQMTLTC